MDTALFVLREEGPPTRSLLGEAGRLAAGVGATLTVLAVGEETDDDLGERARTVGESVLGGIDLHWEAVGRSGTPEEAVLSVADDRDVDHLFVVGTQRSPSGKAIYGDLAQRLVIDFAGPVTTTVPGPT